MNTYICRYGETNPTNDVHKHTRAYVYERDVLLMKNDGNKG